MVQAYGILFQFTQTDKDRYNILLFKNENDCQNGYKKLVEINEEHKSEKMTESECRTEIGKVFKTAFDGLRCINPSGINNGIYKTSHMVRGGVDMGAYIKSEDFVVTVVNSDDLDLKIIG